ADLFLAAAGDISNEDFLNDNLEFKLNGVIENLGLLESDSGTFLLGKQILNSGKVGSDKGVSVLASGDEVFIKNHGSSLMLRVSDDLAEPKKDGIGINNLGKVDGEEVMFSAGDAFADAIYHQGTASADKSVKLHSDGGNIKVSGKIEASSDDGGGRIEIGGTDRGAGTVPRAANVSIFDAAVLDASARSGGDGGDVVIWSDGHTEMFGSIFAEGENGGFAEVSGNTYDFGVSAWRIYLGQGGRFLLDPEDITIGKKLAEEIVKQLEKGTNVTVSTDNDVATTPEDIKGEVTNATDVNGTGDIIVDSDIRVAANNQNKFATLTLDSSGDIIINQSDSADQIRMQNLQGSGSSGNNVFEFKAAKNISINGVIDNFGGGEGQILLDAKGNVDINSTIDANGGAVTILGHDISISNATTSILSGQSTSKNNLVRITAKGDLEFDGGRLELFGDTDIVINANKFINNTGSNVFAVNAASADSVQWSIALPGLTNGRKQIHTFGGLKSNNPAKFGSGGNEATPKNEYHFLDKPTLTVKPNNDSKIYGEVSDSLFKGIEISGLVDASKYGGVFTQDTIVTSVIQDGLTLESSGSKAKAGVGDYNISAQGLKSQNGYEFDYSANGKLTVNQRRIELTAGDQTKVYGEVFELVGEKFTLKDLDGDGDSVLPNGEVITNVSIKSVTGKNSST
ncbi:MAG TPA: hypothetical protein DCE22_04765, partial [Verrucomicrobiales bacterium]|nr:hypothetical protein [Verrucomicrobiales bacterium]